MILFNKGNKKAFETVARVLLSIVTIALVLFVLVGTYFVGFIKGYAVATSEAESQLTAFVDNFLARQTPTPTVTTTPTTSPKNNTSPKPQAGWGGPELWTAVNNKRISYGVNALSQRDELCTIASIRLNELLALGKLDGHEGFSNMAERRPDLKWIFESYGTVAEFLAVGGDSAEDTVGLWDNTLGHKKLLTGGEYVWGCIYAQNSFAVAIAAY